MPSPNNSSASGKPSSAKRFQLGPSLYFVYRDQARACEDVGLYEDDSVSATGIGEPEPVRALDATEGVLPIFGIPPILGRWFSQQDDLPGSPRTVVLGYGFWRRKFGGGRNVVGSLFEIRHPHP